MFFKQSSKKITKEEALEIKESVEEVYINLLVFSYKLDNLLNCSSKNGFSEYFMNAEKAFLKDILQNDFLRASKKVSKVLKNQGYYPITFPPDCSTTKEKVQLDSVFDFDSREFFLIDFYLFFRDRYNEKLKPIKRLLEKGGLYENLCSLHPKYLTTKIELLSIYYVMGVDEDFAQKANEIIVEEFKSVVDFNYANNHFIKIAQKREFSDVSRKYDFHFGLDNFVRVLDNIKYNNDNILEFKRSD